MVTQQVITAEDVLKRFNGNLSHAAAYLGFALPTLRKYRDNGDLGSILIINNSVYVHKNDIDGHLPDSTEQAEWVQIPHSEVPTGLNRAGYKATMVNGKLTYWKHKNTGE